MRPFSVQVLLSLGLTCFLAATGYNVVLAEASYEETIRHAVEEYSLGHWTEARVFFERAHAINPNARTLRGLGLTCYESRNYVEAISYFTQALQSSEQPLTDKMRVDMEQLMQQAQQFVTRLSLTLEPASAELEVDHIARQLPTSAGVMLLDPGEHELSASAEGYLPEQRTINAEGGEQRVQFHLRTVAGMQPAAASKPVQRTHSESSDLAPYIVVGAGAAALLAGGVLVGIAAADKHAVEHPNDGATWAELEPRYNRGRSFFPVGFALMGVGLAGVAAGLAWKLWPTENERAPSAQLRMGPLGFQLSGAF